jgi:hypothetical protein
VCSVWLVEREGLRSRKGRVLIARDSNNVCAAWRVGGGVLRAPPPLQASDLCRMIRVWVVAALACARAVCVCVCVCVACVCVCVQMGETRMPRHFYSTRAVCVGHGFWIPSAPPCLISTQRRQGVAVVASAALHMFALARAVVSVSDSHPHHLNPTIEPITLTLFHTFGLNCFANFFNKAAGVHDGLRTCLT